MRALRILAFAAVLAGCATSPPPGPVEHGRRFADLMSEVGRRFERAGRAASAGNWALAEHDVHEIEEVIEDDVPAAEIPDDVTADLRAIAAALAAGPLEELHHAARARDGARFAAAFAAASEACNGCHRTAGRGFIVVPATPGSEVPVIGPAATAD